VEQAHTNLCSRGRDRLKRIPGARSRPRLWPEAHIAFAYPPPCGQLHGSGMQRQVWKLQHRQQLLALVGRFADTLIQRIVARFALYQRVEHPPQACPLRSCWCRAIREQRPVQLPILLAILLKFAQMTRYNRPQLGIVPPIMHPAPPVAVTQTVVHRRVIAQQPVHDGDIGLGVLGCYRQRIANYSANKAR